MPSSSAEAAFGLQNPIAIPPENDPALRPSKKVPPGEWVRTNLFGGPVNAIITVLLVLFILWLASFLISWTIGADWQIIRSNLRNFMVGGFPRDELWRLWAFGYLLIAGSALGFGALARTNFEQGADDDVPPLKEGTAALLRRFGPALLLVAFLTSFARTALPYIGVAVGIGGFFVLREIGWRLPRSVRDPLAVHLRLLRGGGIRGHRRHLGSSRQPSLA